MIVFEHTVLPVFLWGGVGIAAWLCGAGYLRWVGFGLHTAAIPLTRILFLALLLWCLFLPGKRESETRVIKPRFVVALDTSASMTLSAADNLPTRWEAAREALTMPWTEFVGAECDVDVYPFAERVGRRGSPREAAGLAPDGVATLLRDSLIEMAGRYAGQNVAGLLVLSDGIDTREADDDWVSAAWPFPLYTVLLEPDTAWEKEPDVRIDSVHTPRRVTVGWTTELKAVVSGEGTQGRPQTVELFRNGTPIDETLVQIPAGGGSREVRFELENPQIGSYTYRIHVPPLEGESNRQDNDYEVSVLVIDSANRLLYVDGLPRWESKYLSRALRANQQVLSLGFIKGPQGTFMHFGTRGGMTTELREDQLAFFKIVVLGDLDAVDLDPERVANLTKFVQTGGSLILLGGPRAWGPDGFLKTDLPRIMPVKSWSPRALEGTFPVELTDAGRSHAAFAATDSSLWNILPPVLSLFPEAGLSLGAENLLSAATPGGASPVIAAHRYGQGRVVALLTDSLWKWVLSEKHLEHQPYQRFWNQLLAWAMPEKEELDAREIDIWADREQLSLGEEVEIKARHAGKTAAVDASIACEIVTADERRMTFTMTAEQVLTPSGTTYPGFVTRFKAAQPGIHRVTGFRQVEGRRIESEPVSFYVKPFTPESVPRAANADLLRKLAAGSGGRYFPSIRALNDELSALRFASTEQEQVRYHSLWERWPMIAVLIGLLSTEWILRKLRNMP